MLSAKLDSYPFNYTVCSEKESEVDYSVDLREWACACNDYHYVVRIKNQKADNPRTHTCKHMDEALSQFALDNIDTFVGIMEERERATQKNNTVYGQKRCD